MQNYEEYNALTKRGCRLFQNILKRNESAVLVSTIINYHGQTETMVFRFIRCDDIMENLYDLANEGWLDWKEVDSEFGNNPKHQHRDMIDKWTQILEEE